MKVFLNIEGYKTRLINTLVETATSLPEVEDSKDIKASEKYKRYLQLAFHAVYGVYSAPVGLYKLAETVFAFDKNGNRITDDTLKSITQDECDEFNQQDFYSEKRLMSGVEGIEGVFAEIKPYNEQQDLNDYRIQVMKTLARPFIGNLDEIAKDAYQAERDNL